MTPFQPLSGPQRLSQRLTPALPRLGLSCMVVCILTGLILCFYYRPMGDVFRNVEEITSLVPFGRFFRQLHYISGQLMAVLMLLHTVDHFLRQRYLQYPSVEWVRLLTCLLLCFFTLFTGFVLKGDQEGLFAGRVFMNILKAAPFFGDRLSNLFISPGDDFFFLPYLYHCLLLPAAILYLLRAHIRNWLPDERYLVISAVVMVSYALLIEPRIDIPWDAPVESIEGPWFFLGIQTGLRYLPAVWAGLLIPSVFLALAGFLPAAGRFWSKPIRWLLMVLFCSYGLLTIRAAVSGP
jgi:ubiquinol-cytochrome c reductase cytochrome b subunit